MKTLTTWLTAAMGCGIGALWLTMVTAIFYIIVAPDAFEDPFLIVVLLVTVPFGAVLGGVVGTAAVLARLGEPHRAAEVCRTGGGTIAFLAAVFTLFQVLGSESPIENFLILLLLPWVGCPFVWAMLLAIAGPRLVLRGNAVGEPEAGDAAA